MITLFLTHNYFCSGGVSYGGSGQLAHQPNSLDDLDGETLPFDDVPIRYDSSGEKQIQKSM
jgi:hypothetical protein